MSDLKTKDNWLDYIASISPVEMDLGLTRVRQVLQKLKIIKPALIVITVGGTNGKGSTCTLLSRLLTKAGYSNACYTSPHLHHYNERIFLSKEGMDRQVTDEELCLAFSYIESVRDQIPLTYFEFTTIAAVWLIQRWQVEVAILEVGLGGRLDAVNALDADVSVVTSIGLDHQEWLGDTVDEVAVEKAGIARKDRPFICGQSNPPKALLNKIKEIGSVLHCQAVDFGYHIKASHIDCWSKEKHYVINQSHLFLDNIATAIHTLHVLNKLPSSKDVTDVIAATHLFGRFSQYRCVYRQKRFYVTLDVAHNKQAARILSKQLTDTSIQWGILAMLADKDTSEVVANLSSVDRWICAGLCEPRGQTADQLADQFPASAFVDMKVSSVVEGLNSVLEQIEDQDHLLIVGSFYTVAHAHRYFNQKMDIQWIEQ